MKMMMLNGRRCGKTLMMAVACLLSIVPLVGCQSFAEQYADTNTPLAQNVVTNLNDYIMAMPDGEEKSAETFRSDQFITAVKAGDRDTSLHWWFAEPGVRDSYINFLQADPLYETPDGKRVLAILYNDVQALDYSLSIDSHEVDVPLPEPPEVPR